MKTNHLLALGALAITAALISTPRLRAQSSEIQWQSDVPSAIELAEHTDRLVLLHFRADWCRPCQHLETFVFTNPLVAHRFDDRVVPVKIDVDLHPDLVKEHAITSIPSDVIMTPSGRVLIKQASPKTADDYARLLDRILVARRQADNGHQNTLAQNIDHITGNAIVDTSGLAQRSSFTPQAPSHKAPELPHHANQMARQFANRGDATQKESQFIAHASSDDGDNTGMLRPVDATDQDLDGNSNEANDFAPPQRVVNRAINRPMGNAAPTSRSSLAGASQTTRPSASKEPDDLARKLHHLLENREASQPDALRRAEERTGNSALSPIQTSPDNSPQSAARPNNFAPVNRQTHSNDFVPPAAPRGVATSKDNLPSAAANNKARSPLVPLNPNDTSQNANPANRAATATHSPLAAVTSTAPQPPAVGRPTMPPHMTSPQTAVSETANEATDNAANTNEANAPKLALQGRCPVTLLETSTWVQGNSSIGCVHRGRIYLFVSTEALAKFKAEPDRYSPLLAGYDPVIYHEQGRLVEGKESLGVFMGDDARQSIVLFSTPETNRKFQQNPDVYLKTIQQATRAADARGQQQQGHLHR